MNNTLSLCIPRVDNTITKQYIESVINKYKFGKIKKIKFIKNRKKNNNIVYIYFNYWYNNDYTKNIKKKILNNESIHLFYDEPWFWTLVLNTN